MSQYRIAWRIANGREIIKKTNKKTGNSIHRAEILILLILADNGPMRKPSIQQATKIRYDWLNGSLNMLIEQELVKIIPDQPGQVHTITPAGIAYLNTFEKYAVTWRKPARITQFKR